MKKGEVRLGKRLPYWMGACVVNPENTGKGRGWDLMSAEQAIRGLILDVDGTLTDGGVWVDSSGHEFRRTSTLDGFGLWLWKQQGRKIAIWSGRKADGIVARFSGIGLDLVLDGLSDKEHGFRRILAQWHLPPEAVCVMGDDLLDGSAMRAGGLAIAPANAVAEIRAIADHVTTAKGGDGAVREAVEWILRREGLWTGLVERYVGGPSA
jgi:3-deoxy-D-manno-octulosonate 8-phosphate phosphatase (KDO 8-P phosphatase)